MPADKRPHFLDLAVDTDPSLWQRYSASDPGEQGPGQTILLDTGSWDNTIAPAAAREVGMDLAD